MTDGKTLNGSSAAFYLLNWLKNSNQGNTSGAVDLDAIRQILPDTPYGKGVREIKAPAALDIDSCEGMLVRNSDDVGEWGIFYNSKSSPERQRFTIAHELGHLTLHRELHDRFNCQKSSFPSSNNTLRIIERDADNFASKLLMPGDVLRDSLAGQRIDLHILSALAKQLRVSFEALCIRFIKSTRRRAFLINWDNGFIKYAWHSSSARKTQARIRCSDVPQEPWLGTLAADPDIEQDWDGTEMPAAIWCPDEQPHIRLREFKHSYADRDRVLTLLLLDSA